MKHLGLLLVALVLVVLPCYANVDQPSLDYVEIDSAAIQVIDSLEPPPSGTWEQIQLPENWKYRGFTSNQRTAWYRIAFKVRNTPQSKNPMGIYIPYLYDGGRFFLNGYPVEGIAESDETYHVKWERPHLLYLPEVIDGKPALHPGINFLEIRVTASQASTSVRLPKLYVGPINKLQSLYLHRLFWVRDVAQFTSAFCITLGISALLIWRYRKRKKIYAAFGIGIFLWGLRTLNFVIERLPAEQWSLWRVIYQSASGGVCVAMVLFSFAIAGIKRPLIERALIGYAAIGPAILIGLGSSWDGWVSAIWLGGFLPLLLIFLVAIVYAVWHRRTPTFIALLISIGIAALAGAHDYFLVTNAPWMMRSAPEWVGARIFIMTYAVMPVLLIMGEILIIRFANVLVELEAVNESLDRRVAQKQVELEDTYKRLLRHDGERRVMQERDRIMRDMHDGMGAMLFSTLARTQRGNMTAQEMESALQYCIAEMRLTIDSLSVTEQDVTGLIGDFRYRWETQLENLGVTSQWSINIATEGLIFALDAVVQALKITQEALTNSLKHSGASQIEIQVDLNLSLLRIVLTDNGIGIQGKPREGARGISNMRERASKLGGSLHIESSSSGTKLAFQVPSQVFISAPT